MPREGEYFCLGAWKGLIHRRNHNLKLLTCEFCNVKKKKYVQKFHNFDSRDCRRYLVTSSIPL